MTTVHPDPEAIVTDASFTLTPLAVLHFDHAVRAGRIRGITYARTFAGLTLNDGTVLKITSETEAWIAIRAMASATHTGMTPKEAKLAERVSFGRGSDAEVTPPEGSS